MENKVGIQQYELSEDALYVTVKEAAHKTKCSEQKIRSMIHDGTLKINEKYGRRFRIYRESLINAY
ncbi:MAG: helix-turn-helix domain-containing protein [Sulfurimonas sp.]